MKELVVILPSGSALSLVKLSLMFRLEVIRFDILDWFCFLHLSKTFNLAQRTNVVWLMMLLVVRSKRNPHFSLIHILQTTTLVAWKSFASKISIVLVWKTFSLSIFFFGLKNKLFHGNLKRFYNADLPGRLFSSYHYFWNGQKQAPTIKLVLFLILNTVKDGKKD